MARAAPRCRKSCRQEAASCATTRCSTLRGKARRDCLETCRGISGCAPIRTLAYVVAQCHTDARGLEVARQALEIRRGDCDPVTVVTIGTEPVPDPLGVCRAYGQSRVGPLSVVGGGFQRLGVSPDGKGVVFEKSGDVALFQTRSRRHSSQGSSSCEQMAAGFVGLVRRAATLASNSSR